MDRTCHVKFGCCRCARVRGRGNGARRGQIGQIHNSLETTSIDILCTPWIVGYATEIGERNNRTTCV